MRAKTSGRRLASKVCRLIDRLALEQRADQLRHRRLERRDLAGQVIGAGGLLPHGDDVGGAADEQALRRLAVLVFEVGEPLGDTGKLIVPSGLPRVLRLDQAHPLTQFADRPLSQLGMVVGQLAVSLLGEDVQQLVTNKRNLELAALPGLLQGFLEMLVYPALRLTHHVTDTLQQRTPIFAAQLVEGRFKTAEQRVNFRIGLIAKLGQGLLRIGGGSIFRFGEALPDNRADSVLKHNLRPAHMRLESGAAALEGLRGQSTGAAVLLRGLGHMPSEGTVQAPFFTLG